MKMEVLTVQNQFQSHQFGVIKHPKVEGWTKSLTTPDMSTKGAVAKLATSTVVQRPQELSNQKILPTFPTKSPTKSQNKREIVNLSAVPVLPSLPQADEEEFLYLPPSYNEDAIQVLAFSLEKELRDAKAALMTCTEVLLPCQLLQQIAIEMLEQADSEPCGIRGSNIIIEFEDEPGSSRRLASLKTDPNTVSTFELYLTIKQDRSGWTSILPQFLKNLARGGTIVISHEYSLVKNKLYYSFSD